VSLERLEASRCRLRSEKQDLQPFRSRESPSSPEARNSRRPTANPFLTVYDAPQRSLENDLRPFGVANHIVPSELSSIAATVFAARPLAAEYVVNFPLRYRLSPPLSRADLTTESFYAGRRPRAKTACIPGYQIATVVSGQDSQNGGLSRYAMEKFTTYSAASGLAANTVAAMLRVRRHDVVCNTKRPQVVSNDRWGASYTVKNGLPSDDVELRASGLEGILWIGTAGGLAFLSAGASRGLEPLQTHCVIQCLDLPKTKPDGCGSRPQIMSCG